MNGVRTPPAVEGNMKSVIERMAENNTQEKIAAFRLMQQQDYAFKKYHAQLRAWDFYNDPAISGRCYVSVGGLDSITLFLFLRSIGIHVPGVSCSFLEDKSIQEVHKALGIIGLEPAKKPDGTYWNKAEIIKKFGYPVLSKEIAGKISFLQHPTPKNATVRHAIITGETGAYGGNRKNTRMKMSQKWLEKFGGYENENEGVNYQKPDFLVSDKCCHYLKEKPCDDYAKRSGRFPYTGLLASEGGRRQKTLMINGCNYISKGTKRSAPFAIFSRQDLLRLALEMEDWYHQHWQEFGDTELERIIPGIYGELVRDPDGTLRTTKAQRTGCSMCGFGVHKEKRPHRFDWLREQNPKEWNFWMYDMGWGHVLDYIGVGWKDYPGGKLEGQIEMEANYER